MACGTSDRPLLARVAASRTAHYASIRSEPPAGSPADLRCRIAYRLTSLLTATREFRAVFGAYFRLDQCCHRTSPPCRFFAHTASLKTTLSRLSSDRPDLWSGTPSQRGRFAAASRSFKWTGDALREELIAPVGRSDARYNSRAWTARARCPPIRRPNLRESTPRWTREVAGDRLRIWAGRRTAGKRVVSRSGMGEKPHKDGEVRLTTLVETKYAPKTARNSRVAVSNEVKAVRYATAQKSAGLPAGGSLRSRRMRRSARQATRAS